MGHDPGVDRGGIDEGEDGRAGYRGQVQHRQKWPSGLANVACDVIDGGCGDGTHARMVVRRRRSSELFVELSRELDPLEGVDVPGTGVDRGASYRRGVDHRLRGIDGRPARWGRVMDHRPPPVPRSHRRGSPATRSQLTGRRARVGGRGRLPRNAHRLPEEVTSQTVSAASCGSARSSSVREVMSSLVNTLRRWYSTVRRLMKSRAPISGFESRSRASRAMCAS